MNKLLFNQIGSKNPKMKSYVENESPSLKVIANDALSRAIEIGKKVDAAIEKMKPIGAS